MRTPNVGSGLLCRSERCVLEGCQRCDEVTSRRLFDALASAAGPQPPFPEYGQSGTSAQNEGLDR